MNKIENEYQVELTQKWISEFKNSLTELEAKGDEGNRIKYELFINSNKAMIKDLEEQLRVYYDETKWVNTKFGEHWIQYACKEYDVESLAEIALKNGRARIRLATALEKLIQGLNPNNPQQSEFRKIAEYAIFIDKRV